MAATPTLILASASPRRRDLLRKLGYRFVVEVPDIDESPHVAESPAAYVARIAAAKADAVYGRLARPAPVVVLAADTTVTIDDEILGKPDDATHAEAMLRKLSGRSHAVLTAVAIASHAPPQTLVATTAVTMTTLDDDLIADYVACGEWRGKAGGYAVQGIGAALVASVAGSVTNVIGLPLCETMQALRAVGMAPMFTAGQPE